MCPCLRRSHNSRRRSPTGRPSPCWLRKAPEHRLSLATLLEAACDNPESNPEHKIGQAKAPTTQSEDVSVASAGGDSSPWSPPRPAPTPRPCDHDGSGDDGRLRPRTKIGRTLCAKSDRSATGPLRQIMQRNTCTCTRSSCLSSQPPPPPHAKRPEAACPKLPMCVGVSEWGGGGGASPVIMPLRLRLPTHTHTHQKTRVEGAKL